LKDNITSDERLPQSSLPSQLSDSSLSVSHPSLRIHHPKNGGCNVSFDANDIGRFHGSKTRLTGTCINSAGALLVDLTRNNRTAIFSTYTLVYSRRQATDDVLWRNIKNTTFWDKEVWIFPVHRSSPGHWVLCTAYIRERRLLLFDSLGGRRDWDNDLKVYPQISLSINILTNRNVGYHLFD
jgi:hypothetical protein